MTRRRCTTQADRPSDWTPAPGARTALPGDMPLDQRRDDALSLSFEIRAAPPSPQRSSATRSSRCGSQAIARRRSSSPGSATSGPDGAATLVARGVLNLCHHAGHDAPRPLTPGEPVDATVSDESGRLCGPRRPPAAAGDLDELLAVAVAVARAGDDHDRDRRRQHRRDPGPAPQPIDATLPAFGPAEQAPPLPVTWLRQPDPGVRFAIDPGGGETSCEIRRDFAAGQRFPSGLEYRDHDPVDADDPRRRSAVVRGRDAAADRAGPRRLADPDRAALAR